MEEDLYRIYTLREMGYMPFVMIYDKQKFVDRNGRWLPDAAKRYSKRELQAFKVCQHMQRWCGQIQILTKCPRFEEYEPYRRWVEKENRYREILGITIDRCGGNAFEKRELTAVFMYCYRDI